jgi:radical SAM superfamily enzyme YgiQ (UPF0313 family)
METREDVMAEGKTDLVLINPGGREHIYQELGGDLTAVEPPLWCRLIAGYVRDRGHSVAILDTEAEELGPDRLAEKVSDLDPSLVCVVVYGHQPSASTQQMVGARLACLALREQAPDRPVIIVGGHVSALAERTLREEAVTYACKGEGPQTVAALLEAIKDGRDDDLAQVPGLVWWNGREVVINPPPPLIKDLDRELHGAAWDLLPMDRYRAHNWQCFGDLASREPYASIYTSLGCPYKCSFCCINAPFGTNRYRMRSPEKVVEEIAFLHDRYNVKTFKIVDEMFVLNDRHVRRICELLSDLDLDLNIWAYARVDTVRPDILESLRKAGIRWLALGIESGSAHVRDGADKSFTTDDILTVVHNIQRAGIHVIGNFIFGLPDDDHRTMRETLDLALELNCEFVNFYCAMAYPGSPLYEMAVQQGWPLPEAWSGFSQHSYDCLPLATETLGPAEVLRFRDNAFHEYFASPRYLNMVTQRFGLDTRRHVAAMARHRLRRGLLEAEGVAS